MQVRRPPSAVILSSCHRGCRGGPLSSNIQGGQSSPLPLLWATSRPINRKCLYASPAFPSAVQPLALWRGRPVVLQPFCFYTPFFHPLLRYRHVVSLSSAFYPQKTPSRGPFILPNVLSTPVTSTCLSSSASGSPALREISPFMTTTRDRVDEKYFQPPRLPSDPSFYFLSSANFTNDLSSTTPFQVLTRFHQVIARRHSLVPSGPSLTHAQDPTIIARVVETVSFPPNSFSNKSRPCLRGLNTDINSRTGHQVD